MPVSTLRAPSSRSVSMPCIIAVRFTVCASAFFSTRGPMASSIINNS
jgi:hypothetical protein